MIMTECSKAYNVGNYHIEAIMMQSYIIWDLLENKTLKRQRYSKTEL